MLLREYAMQPGVFTDCASIRFFLSQMGIPYGRMISRYPKRWIRMVYDACARSDIEQARAEVLTAKLKTKLLPSSRPYNGGGASWVDNALTEHAREPFTGVILADEETAPRSGTVVSASDVDDDCPCWRVSCNTVVDRQADALCRPAKHLLCMSREVVFVDRYFDAGSNHGRPLMAFLTQIMAGAAPSRLEYHFDDRASQTHIVDRLQRMLQFLPDLGLTPLRFIRWKQLPDEDGLHPRYILTEHGGMKYDWGLGEESGKTTDVLLLGPEDEIYIRRWSEYSAASTTFDFVDGFEILNGQVYRIVHDAGFFKNIGPA